MKDQIRLALCIVVLAGIINAASAQSSYPAKDAGSAPTPASTAKSESLLIGPGDLVHATFFQVPELETKARVTDAGDINLPLAGQVSVSGLTPIQASAKVEQLYASKHYLKSPQISIAIDEYATQSVSIMGEVQRPGTFPITTPRSVIDVLAFAGGLTPLADHRITIQHRGQQDTKQDVFLPNDANNALAAQVKVYPGDLIVVPKAGIVYVLGDVGHPGGYVMQDDSTLTVLQAVAMASGANRTASESHARLVRRTAQGYSEIPVPLKDMQKGKVADMALQHDDILWVPFSYGKNIVIGGTSIVGVAASAAVYRF
jgi:polysaccharide export outer membrane protein